MFILCESVTTLTVMAGGCIRNVRGPLAHTDTSVRRPGLSISPNRSDVPAEPRKFLDGTVVYCAELGARPCNIHTCGQDQRLCNLLTVVDECCTLTLYNSATDIRLSIYN